MRVQTEEHIRFDETGHIVAYDLQRKLHCTDSIQL